MTPVASWCLVLLLVVLVGLLMHGTARPGLPELPELPPVDDVDDDQAVEL